MSLGGVGGLADMEENTEEEDTGDDMIPASKANKYDQDDSGISWLALSTPGEVVEVVNRRTMDRR
jgi:hypothetical protein